MKYKHIIQLTVLGLTGALPHTEAEVNLGSAENFAVLGASTVTSTGNTVINGDLGVSPGTAITGFGPGVVNGTTYSSGAVAAQAASDALTAYNEAGSETSIQNLTGQNLGGLTLSPGVRNFSSSAQLTGTLILNAQGNPDAQFVFQIGSTLTTASTASIELINGAQADNVFWQVGSSATIGTDSVIYGSILADASITLTTGASLTGRAVALNGAVTMDDNSVSVATVPEPNSFLAGALCLITFGVGKGVSLWRKQRRHQT